MRNYIIIYSIKITTNRNSYVRNFSYKLEAICKLHALLKFKKLVKHTKHYQRKIISIRRIK